MRDDEASNEAATPQELDVIVESPFSKVDEDAPTESELAPPLDLESISQLLGIKSEVEEPEEPEEPKTNEDEGRGCEGARGRADIARSGAHITRGRADIEADRCRFPT